ncbi:MAG: hypothetical protein LC687_05950, partial [Actinobacteria bacterium]|nr:hypothetical protein [Actinomycetota bacterium]
MSEIDHGIESTRSNSPDDNSPERLDQAVPQQQVPFYRNRAFQALSGLVLVGGAFGVGLSLGESEDSGETQEQSESENTLPEITTEESDLSNAADSDTPEFEPEDDGAQTAQDLQQQNRNREVTSEENILDSGRETSDQEQLVEFDPTPITGNTLNKVLEQYVYNLDCMLNAEEPDVQLECGRFIYGDRPSSVRTRYIELAEEYNRIRSMTSREYNSYVTELNIIDSDVAPDETMNLFYTRIQA